MRVNKCHHNSEPFVRRPNHPHLAIGFRNVLHQPIYRVIRICRIVDATRIQRPQRWGRHPVPSFRTILPAHVLEYPDVAGMHKYIVALWQFVEHVGRLVPRRPTRRIVRCPRKEDRSVRCALGNNNNGVELHAVPHGNHDNLFDIVIIVARSNEGFRNIRRAHRGLRPRRRKNCKQTSGNTQSLYGLHDGVYPFADLHEVYRLRSLGSIVVRLVHFLHEQSVGTQR